MGDALWLRCRPGRVKQHRQLVGVAAEPIAGRISTCGPGVDVGGGDFEQQLDLVLDLAALVGLLLATEGDEGARRRLLDQRRQLRHVEHRRQRREHDAAVQATEHRNRRLDRVAPEQHDDVARLDAGIAQLARDAERGLAQAAVGDSAVVEDEGRAVRAFERARFDVFPQVA